MTREERKQIAKTIWTQLGANKFQVMTGVRGLVYMDEPGPGLQFDMPRAKDGINRVSIQLNANDLYDMRFFKVRRGKLRTTFTLIYRQDDTQVADMREVFRLTTGLDTSL